MWNIARRATVYWDQVGRERSLGSKGKRVVATRDKPTRWEPKSRASMCSLDATYIRQGTRLTGCPMGPTLPPTLFLSLSYYDCSPRQLDTSSVLRYTCIFPPRALSRTRQPNCSWFYNKQQKLIIHKKKVPKINFIKKVLARRKI